MRANQTAYVILSLLSIEPRQSGYDIRKTIEGSIGFFWHESFGQIYPTLKRLAGEGLVAETEAADSGDRKRYEYTITSAGRACLKEWLALPCRRTPTRDEFLLKLFFGRSAAPGVTVGHARDFRARVNKLLAKLREIEAIGREKHRDHPHLPYWLLTLEYGYAQINAALAWSENALARLADLDAAESTAPRARAAARTATRRAARRPGAKK